jgi:hypothetical protein
MSSKISSPIFIKVQVNNKQQHAIIDTGSAVTIINQQLLKNIHHKNLSTSINYTNQQIVHPSTLSVKFNSKLKYKDLGH